VAYIGDSHSVQLISRFNKTNILVTNSSRACIADFGLATAMDSQLISTGVGTSRSLRWQAPELLDYSDIDDRPNTHASDVYNFACVCYEVSHTRSLGKPEPHPPSGFQRTPSLHRDHKRLPCHCSCDERPASIPSTTRDMGQK
jgi:serine/threonine protein kinase